MAQDSEKPTAVSDPFASLVKLPVGKPRHLPLEDQTKAEAAAAHHGFQEDTVRAYKRDPRLPPQPKTAMCISLPTTLHNDFVDWCKKERMSYPQGFAHLMKLLEDSKK